MTNCVLVPSKITAMDVDAYNERGIYTAAVNNGTPLVRGALSTTSGQGEVFSVTPASAIAADLWMAYSPEVVTTVDGSLSFKGLDVNPQDYTNVANVPFDMFKPNAGVDIIQVTGDFFSATPASDATYVELNSSGAFVARNTATTGYTGLGFSIIGSAPITIANGALGGEQVTAYYLLCTQN